MNPSMNPSMNPYLEEAQALGFGLSSRQLQSPRQAAFGQAALAERQRRGMQDADVWTRQEELVREYSYAIPNDEALDVLAAHAPLIEIGAGLGYWASLLRARGVDTLAYDLYPPFAGSHDNEYCNQRAPWTEILHGGPEMVTQHPDRTLFLCWPPYKSTMASQCLSRYTGATVLYIGEPNEDGCTGDAQFHRLLRQKFTRVQYVGIPQWDKLHDALYVWERK